MNLRPCAKSKLGRHAAGSAYLIFPLELGPHRTERFLAARGRLDIVHDIHVYVVQIDVGLLRSRTVFVHDCPEDMARLRATHLLYKIDITIQIVDPTRDCAKNGGRPVRERKARRTPDNL